MPELPEMQALAERLHDLLDGKVLRALAPMQFSALKTVNPPADALVGLPVEQVSRRGKFLIIGFGGPRMLIHLSQGGRIDVETPPKTTKPKGSVLRMLFEDGIGLLVKEFGTERKAGWWVLAAGEDGPLELLGPEPSDEAFAELILHGADKRHIHTLLRDQRTAAGIGRGFADDALHRAGLSPFRSLAALKDGERVRLLDAVRAVLDEALAEERKRVGGLPAKLGDRFTIHRNAGKPCPRCSETLRKVWYESHEIVYCPRCQTGGKVLADRRLSRLLR